MQKQFRMAKEEAGAGGRRRGEIEEERRSGEGGAKREKTRNR